MRCACGFQRHEPGGRGCRLSESDFSTVEPRLRKACGMSRRSRTNGSSETVTLSEVARVAGVSLATASRALNGSPNRKVGEDLVKRVQWAAEELNYSPNAHAQAMARGHTNVVGLIVSDINDPYFSTMAAGVIGQAEQHGLLVTMAITQRSTEREIEYVETLRRQRARAMIIA